MNVIDRLSEERVVDIYLNQDLKTISFIEGCDNYFELNLTKKEVLSLIEELIILTSTMID